MQKRVGKSGITGKKFFGSTLPTILIAAFLVTAALHLTGVIDLKQVGEKVKSLFEPPGEDETTDIVTVKIKDGVVNVPYRENVLYYIQMRTQKGLTCPCKYIVEEMMIPGGLRFGENDALLMGVPQFAGTWTFDVCITDLEEYGTCLDNIEFSITIYPEPQVPVLVTGNYTGPFEFTDNVGNPLFRDTGTLKLQSANDGDVIRGSYSFTNIKMQQLTSFDQVQLGTTAPDFSKSIWGKVNGNNVDFTDGWIKFSGTLDSEKLILNIESCSLDKCCVNPEHVGRKGESTPSNELGVPDVPAPTYTCEAGIIGSANLNRINPVELPEEEPEEEKPTIVHKPYSVLDIPLNCIRYRDDSCGLFNCIFEQCRCVENNPIVYEKSIAVNSEEEAMSLVKEYVESERSSYIVKSALKLNKIFYNVYGDDNGNEIIYTVTSNGIVMKTECEV